MAVGLRQETAALASAKIIGGSVQHRRNEIADPAFSFWSKKPVRSALN